MNKEPTQLTERFLINLVNSSFKTLQKNNQMCDYQDKILTNKHFEDKSFSPHKDPNNPVVASFDNKEDFTKYLKSL